MLTNGIAFMSSSVRGAIPIGVIMAVVCLQLNSVLAATSQVPWECSRYSDEAQSRCMEVFIERQSEQIETLKAELQEQRDIVDQLKSRVDRQAATTTDLGQQLSRRSTTMVFPPPFYTYAYPPAGFGVWLGRPWIYGPPYFYHHYWGPRFYHRHR